MARTSSPSPATRCPTCRYDLSGHAPRDDQVQCPECGATHHHLDLALTRQFPWVAVGSASVPWIVIGLSGIVLPMLTYPERTARFLPGLAIAAAVTSMTTLFVVARNATGRNIRHHLRGLIAFAIVLNGTPFLMAWLLIIVLSAADR